MAGTLSYAAGPSSDRGELSASAAFAVGREADPTAGQGVGPLPGTGSAESAASPDEPKKRTALENKASFTGPMLRSKSGERRSVDALVFSTSGRYHSATKQHHLGLPGYAYSRRHKKGENVRQSPSHARASVDGHMLEMLSWKASVLCGSHSFHFQGFS